MAQLTYFYNGQESLGGSQWSTVDGRRRWSIVDGQKSKSTATVMINSQGQDQGQRHWIARSSRAMTVGGAGLAGQVRRWRLGIEME